MKNLFITLAALVAYSAVSAQGFSSFKSDAFISEAFIKDRGELSVVEAIVLGDCDITNLPVKHRLWSGCAIETDTPLTADFSKPQTVKVSKSGEGTKTWAVTVHQLKPTSLPANINFSAANPCDLSFTNPKPWATCNVAPTHTNVIRMGDVGSTLYVAFDDKAKEVAFDVTVLSDVPFAGELNVETSADGKKWDKTHTYSASNPFKGKRETLALPAGARYIRWVYAVRDKQNIHMNNISIQ